MVPLNKMNYQKKGNFSGISIAISFIGPSPTLFMSLLKVVTYYFFKNVLREFL